MRNLAIAAAGTCLLAATIPAVTTAAAHPPETALSGAIFTTDRTGKPVNLNIYDMKRDVYLNGGPGINAPDDAAGLPAAGELLAHLIDRDGNLCDYELNARLVAMSPAELDAVPMTIGVAAGANKIAPICAALRGNHLKALVLDEATANGVLETMSK